MMSKRQAARLLEKTKHQVAFFERKGLLVDISGIFNAFYDLQNRLQKVIDGKVKEEREVREMNLIKIQMGIINDAIKKVFTDEKQKSS